MAETSVGIVTNKLIPLLRDEVTLLKGVHAQVEWVKDELLLIQAFLKDADAKAERSGEPNNGVKAWVKQLREVAFRIEDVVDLYLLRVAERRGDDDDGYGHPLEFVAKICFCIESILPRHEISSDINEIKGVIIRLTEARETLGLSPNSSRSGTHVAESRHGLRMGAHYIDDDQLVGVDSTKELLTSWLLTEDPRRTVIAVVGQGGLGKTTIVKNVYKKQKERKSFECYAWITVSRSFKKKYLLKAILQDLYQEDGNKVGAKEVNETVVMSQGDSIDKIRKHLQGRSYMIVFDDVWEQDFWVGVEFALPPDSNGRIIITTRDAGVAGFCKSYAPVCIHELEPLPSTDALKLFLNKAFQFDSEGCPEELMELSQDFVKKCEGVPLAIEAIAGLLSTKTRTVIEWRNVYSSLHSKFSSDPHLRSFYQVLLESYHDLPYHLKSCLLYFSLFPEGYLITCTRLTRLWVAEGFIKEGENNDQTQEDTAQEYLGELIRRSLVKVSELHGNGRVRSCRIHDLMYTFIIRKCEDMNYCQLMKNEEFRYIAPNRRLSIHKNIEKFGVESDRLSYGRVRSCFSFDIEKLENPLVVESLMSRFKLLVALDFENSSLTYLPETVGMLLNLKYLNVSKTKIKTIPKFIGKLVNLETLNVKRTQVWELPEEINKLLKLRHLIGYSSEYYYPRISHHGMKLNKGVGCLTALQSLMLIDTIDADDVIKELKNLTKLRRLGVKLRKSSGDDLCSAIKNMTYLCSLAIMASENEEYGDLDLQSLIDPPQNLQRLYLFGRLENLPTWIPKLRNLVRLGLLWSRLPEDPLPILKSLSKLEELFLYEIYEGDEVHFKEGWFTKLKHLKLQNMPHLKTLKIDKKALPYLEQLELGPCPQMLQVPGDIHNLVSLKCLYLYKMPSQFVENIRTQLKENIRVYVSDDWHV